MTRINTFNRLPEPRVHFSSSNNRVSIRREGLPSKTSSLNREIFILNKTSLTSPSGNASGNLSALDRSLALYYGDSASLENQKNNLGSQKTRLEESLKKNLTKLEALEKSKEKKLEEINTTLKVRKDELLEKLKRVETDLNRVNDQAEDLLAPYKEMLQKGLERSNRLGAKKLHLQRRDYIRPISKQVSNAIGSIKSIENSSAFKECQQVADQKSKELNTQKAEIEAEIDLLNKEIVSTENLIRSTEKSTDSLKNSIESTKGLIDLFKSSIESTQKSIDSLNVFIRPTQEAIDSLYKSSGLRELEVQQINRILYGDTLSALETGLHQRTVKKQGKIFFYEKDKRNPSSLKENLITSFAINIPDKRRAKRTLTLCGRTQFNRYVSTKAFGQRTDKSPIKRSPLLDATTSVTFTLGGKEVQGRVNYLIQEAEEKRSNPLPLTASAALENPPKG